MGDMQYIQFEINNDKYAINISNVREIVEVENITKIPGRKKHVEGITKVRDEIITVINLRNLMGYESTEKRNNRMLVLENSKNQKTGFIVDNTDQIIRVTEENIERNLEILENNGIEISNILKIEEDIILELNLNKFIEV